MNAPRAAPRPIISRILFAVDFAPCAEHAAPYVRAFATRYGAQLWLAHAVIPGAALDAVLIQSENAVADAEQHMARFLESEPWRDLRYRVIVRPGELWPTLSNIIQQEGIDLVVAGTQGRNWLARMMLGSGAEEIVRHASCPVLTISPHVPREASDALLRIVFPLALEHDPHSAIAYALALANDNKAQVLFLHVVHRSARSLDDPDEAEIDDEQYGQAMARITELIPAREEFRRDPEIIIEAGVPADTILEVAKRTSADLILMPVRRVTGAHAPWSTAYRVLAHAPCPVLTVGE